MIRLSAIICFAVLNAAVQARADDKPADPTSLVVVSSGTGADEKAALKQAFENAVTQAVGTIVDAETVVKDDKIITDQVLTASNAIITHYDPIGPPRFAGGLVTVKIKATVQKKQLTDRLAAANVISKPVEGNDLFAQAVTDLQREKDGVAIVRRVFDGFPGNVLKAESIGPPRLISETDADAKLGVTIRYSYDADKYGKWLAAVTPFLSKIATKSEQRRLSPADGVMASLDNSAVERFGSHVPEAARRGSYRLRGRVNLVANDDPQLSALVLIQRAGGSGATVLHLDDSVCREVVRATFAVPVAEILLKDQAGTEIDGVTRVLLFRLPNKPSEQGCVIDVDPFFRPSLVSRFFDYGGLAPVDQDWKPEERELNTNETAVVVAPYIGCQGTGGPYLLTAYDMEYEFVVPLDRLKQIKAVEVRIYSRNNLTGSK